ncbi:hypothetical protein [Mycobacterium tuberculosis]|uniref:hypothetical protein n=1 Tax=Mycobacterium tuberculosis TaxID=1773 RepID=UPI001F3CC6B4|nr:hypothetical protein [Mycobacterium tuberculosis]
MPTTLNARDQPPAEVSDQRVSGLTGAVHCPDNQIQHGLVIDRILGLSDSSITVLTRAQVEAMVAALPRSY